jgi:CubicO group peptidase (beta-lactamase class C family)
MNKIFVTSFIALLQSQVYAQPNDLVTPISIINDGLNFQPADLSAEWSTNNDFPLSEELEEFIDSQIATLPNTLGFIVIHRGEIVSENYFNSNAENEININSVTKSFISTLVGQAVDMNLIEDPDSSLSVFFPENDIDYLSEISLHDLLSMTTGYLDGHPYFWINQSTENLLSMEHSSPGSFFYNNSACHINSHVIFNKTGMTPLEFGNNYLFPHLGIENPNWDAGYQNISDGSVGLYLNLRDMVKLGQLYLQGGLSGSEQIISSDWVQRATNVQTATDWGYYGYLWWLLDDLGTSYSAQGLGGQVIAVYPEYDLVIGAQSEIDWANYDTDSHSELLNYRIHDIALMFENLQLNNDNDVQSPSSFKLYSNYPNPFNPVTTLRYDLPEDGLVNITIYDMMGRVVKTLVNSSQIAGYKSIQWNATNDRNELVSAGLYLYTIQAGEFRQTRKMVLLK